MKHVKKQNNKPERIQITSSNTAEIECITAFKHFETQFLSIYSDGMFIKTLNVTPITY